MLPVSFAGRSDHCAIKKIYLEVVQCSNLPFLDASNFQGAKICVTGVMHGLLMDNGGGAAGEAKTGETMDKEWVDSIAWYNNVLYFNTEMKTQVFSHLGGEHFDPKDTITMQLTINGQPSGDAVTIPLSSLIDANELYTEYDFAIVGGEETATVMVRANCISYHDDEQIM
jgi:hypothetical protein